MKEIFIPWLVHLQNGKICYVCILKHFDNSKELFFQKNVHSHVLFCVDNTIKLI